MSLATPNFGMETRRARSPYGVASGLVSILIVALAAAPYAGWRWPLVWLGVMAGPVIAEKWLDARRGVAVDGAEPAGRFNPFAWLINAGYSAAALYLTCFYTGAAQTLGVTLYGVVMFQILAHTYASPRRLVANLLAPVLAMVAVQLYATTLLVQAGQPWKILTLLASPLVVYRAFRAVQYHLNRSRRLEGEALARLTESQTRYRLLADSSPDVIIRYDVDGRIDYLSPAARSYRTDAETLVGRNIREVLDPNDWERNAEFLRDLAAGRPTPQGEQNIWHTWGGDGAPLAFEGATSPIRDDDGRVVGAVAVLRDVTAREALHEELERRRAEAEAATQAKSQFLANMSHEVRTPLTGVIGFARLLEAMEDLPALARGYVSRIGRSAEALLLVVNDVLDFSKLEAGQVDLDPQQFDPAGFLEETLDLVRDQAAAKGLELSLSMPGAPGDLVADRARLRQVVLNLLTNAIKFTAKGEIAVSAEHLPAERLFKVAVRDTGPGLNAEQGARLFQRFSQIDGSNTRQHGGAGLGLAISKGLVELMGGQIGLVSEPGRGATFWFTIAAATPEAGLASPGAAAVPSAAIEPLEVGRLRLLVVDDVAVNRELVCAILSPFDLEVALAASGAEAVEAALAQTFDLILMDLQMPGMDGLAATKAIRANAELNRMTPILALSANVLPAHVEACLAAGMADHVGKPIDPADLLAKIVKWTTAPDASDDERAVA
jgi:PAS domain S-box-containing protein